MNNFHMREGKVEFRWKRWRNKKRQEVSSCLMVLFSGAVLLGAGGVALAGPTGGQITGGTGTITTPNTTTTNINQQSNVLNINWQDFSIGAGETVNFYQPGATSIAINRVVGGVPSYLAGALNANGRVFILNSAGITFTGTSQVNVGALLATTAMTVNGDPTQAASYSGSGYGAVINQGSISVSNGGFAILAAPYVQNTGFIKADLGTIALAGTNQFTLDLSGTGLINFVVPASAVEKIVSDGKAVGVDNSGTLQARSGQVVISANVASEVVNAVVNLNGIVDADAFAANGQGGAVLVTAAGDINVGGQVTAKGSGAGAGGQIVTKAAGSDNIEQMAFVSAAGGAAGGVGGNIEVSGKTVGLNGAIDPGNGGLLYIDPLQFTIRNATSGQSASGIGEHRLEALLQNGAGFLVNAKGNITIQDLSDNVLAGGPGDLTLHAGTGGAGNIIVQGVGDTIRTGGGDVTLTAAGNIGDSTHRLSFVSGGANLSGISQAGDIILTATNGGNIYINSVTERSAGPGAHHALFSANAAGVFSAQGLIDLEVRDNGVGTQSADAEVHIVADQIRLAGLNVLANATKFASSGSNAGGNAFANAIVTLNAVHASDVGAMTVAATVAGSSGFRFHANAQLMINEQTGFFMKGGPISVMARANAFSAGTSGVFDNAVLANAGLSVNGSGPVEIDSLGVHATAVGDKVANDVASAHADLNGTDINIYDGNASVTANGQAGPIGAALVVARASMNATGNAVEISSNVTVTAEANNPDLGRGASATADLQLIAVSNNVTVGGDITVNALALNGGNSFAAAVAILNVTGDQGVAIDGDVSVIANGQTLAEAGTDLSTPHATASANVFSRNGNIHIGGNLDVEASADDQNLDSVRAHARAHIVASGFDFQSISIDGFTKVTANAKTNAQNVFNSGSPHGASASASLMIHAKGHVFLGNDVTVKATASDLGRFQANALANVSITATASTGEFGAPLAACSITILGNVDVEATAHDPVGNGALANAEFFANAYNGVQIGFAGSDGNAAVEANLTVAALADNGGLGNASAIGVASIIGKFGPVGVFGDVSVTANAHDAGGGNAFANAFANFSGSGSGGRPGVEIGGSSFSGASVGGHVDVKANAVEDNGAAAVAVAGASFDAGSGQSGGGVAIHNGINVVADANNHGTEASHMAASASAHLNFFARKVEVNGAMSITAHATNSGFGRVNAHGAVAFNSATTINLGDVTIDVKALNLGSNGSGGAKASANFIETNSCVSLTLDSLNLQAQASTHGGGNAIANAIARITQSSLSIPGDVTINALAFRSDPPAASGSANALASLELRAGISDLHVGGDIKVTANAVDQNSGLAQANAHALLASSATVHVDGSILVSALASAQGKAGGTAANANAQLIFEDASNVIVGGDMSIIAHGTNHGQGKVLASGRVDFGTASNINLGPVLIDVRALNLGASGSGGANANAKFSASTDVNLSITSLNLQAQASSFGSGNAHALASANIAQGSGLTIGGDVTVNALAVAHGGGNALAQANLLLSATSGDLTVSGAIDVHANANASGAGQAQASAIASLDASSGESGRAVDVHNVNVIANAYHSGTGGPALALAELSAKGSKASFDGAVNVKASADNTGGLAGAGTGASANALFKVSASSGITVTSDLNVFAHATNNGKGRVIARGSIDFGSASQITLANVTIDVAALNQNSQGTGGAVANAIFKASGSSTLTLDSLNLQAQANSAGAGNAVAIASGKLAGSGFAIGGDITINAAAYAHNGNAQANAIGLINATSAAFSVDSVHVTANALVDNNGEAQAIAKFTANPATFNASGDVIVKATALNNGGASGAGAVGASASALLDLAGAKKIEVDGLTSVAGLATNNGQGKVFGKGSIDFASATALTFADVVIDVAALNLGAGNGGAVAVAKFVPPGAATVTINSVNVQAQASSHGTGNANAVASVDLEQATLDIAGNVIVNAQAVSDPGNASALANLSLGASTGTLHVGGNVFVKANAVESAGNANAQALAVLAGSDEVHIGGASPGAGHLFVGAYASGNGQASGDTGAQANALVTIKAPLVVVDNSASIIAHASNNGHGKVKGVGQLNFLASPNVEFDQLTIDVKALNKSKNGSGGAVASAILTSGGVNSIQFTGLNLQAEASSNGGGNAVANAIANLQQASFSVENDIVINAVAFTDGPDGNALALAELELDATGLFTPIIIGGNVEVTAYAHGDDPNNVMATADVGLHAEGFVHIGGNVDVEATASTNAVGNFANRVIANALLDITATAGVAPGTAGGVFFGSSFSIDGQLFRENGNVTVSANEISNGAQQGVALANAQISAGILAEAGASVGVVGNLSVTADAGGGSNAANVVALAELNMFATVGESINGDVDVQANASDPGNGIAHAGANATIVTDVNRIFVNGNIEVDAILSGNALTFGTASLDTVGHPINAGFASAFLDVRTLNADVQGIELNGVSVTANTLLTNPAAAVSTGEVITGAAGAIADVTIETSGSVHIDGAVSVNAQANIAPTGAEGIAQATLTGTAKHGSFGIESNVAVTANLQIASPGSAFATASANVFAGGQAFMARNVTITATASTHASGEHATDLVLAKANLVVKGVHGAFFGTTSISANGHQNFFSGNVGVAAKTVASHGGIDVALSNVMLTASGEGAGIGVAGNLTVTADATGGTNEADVVAIASLNAEANGFASFIGAVTVKANATDPGTGAAYAGAFALLSASEEGVFVGGNINVAANLQANELALGSFSSERLSLFTPAGFADASLTIESDSGSIFTRGISVTANALLTNPDRARHIGEGESSTSAGARANLNLFAGSNIFVSGPVTVNALANVSPTGLRVLASANGEISASTGDVRINGPVRVRANAQAFGSEFLSDDAYATLTIDAGHDIILPNVAVRAIADASGFAASGSALADLTLNAAHDIFITGGGAFAGASANMPNDTQEGSHILGSADLLINAGHSVFINGDVGAAAVALGGGTGDVANAIVDIEAGNSGFGNASIFGNLYALAFADPVNDHALASITVNAHNNILIVGNDPIASAHAGNAAAFLQTHFTDSRIGFGGSGSSATARITITAGGNIVVINPDFDNVLALLALPTQTSPMNPGELTEIQLLIDGQDCGVLGSAGADPNKPAACAKGPINVPGSDSLP